VRAPPASDGSRRAWAIVKTSAGSTERIVLLAAATELFLLLSVG
jgi:hypothetical protein